MNRKAVLDLVHRKLRKQKKAATTYGRKCAYKALDGRRCSIGWLLPDDTRKDVFEFDGNVEELLDEYPCLRGILEIEYDEDILFLMDLQCAHDSLAGLTQAAFMQGLPTQIHKVATKWRL